MKEFKETHIPKLNYEGVDYVTLVLGACFSCLLCVYILSCICSLYDKMKEANSLVGKVEYGVVRESESED